MKLHCRKILTLLFMMMPSGIGWAQDCGDGTIASRLRGGNPNLHAFAAIQAVTLVQAQVSEVLERNANSKPVKIYASRLKVDQQAMEQAMREMAESEHLDLTPIEAMGESARKDRPNLEILTSPPKKAIDDADLVEFARREQENGITNLTLILLDECRRGVRSLVGNTLVSLESELLEAQRLAKQTGEHHKAIIPRVKNDQQVAH